MFNKKQWTEFLLLVLIGQEDHLWSGYQLKKYIETKYEKDASNTFPILREMVVNEVVSAKLVIDENHREKKYYQLTDKGRDKLANYRVFTQEINNIIKEELENE